MKKFFEDIDPIKFAGKNADALAYRYYDPQKKILGKTMEEHLRLAICFWHTFSWKGHDIFGDTVFDRPWHKNETAPMELAETQVHAAFEFIEKLGLKFFTFHDRDVVPEGDTLQQTQKNLYTIADQIAAEMQRTNIKLLWGTANLFGHRRYLAGAATNPNPDVFAYAVAQVKQAIDITHQLGGENYVLWGGREGYDTLLNTDMKQEFDQLARFLSMLVDYRHKIGFKGTLLIEPKPCEPTKHQYDYDTATVFAFLQKYHLENEFKVNIEANHATLAGHSFPHEVAYAFANNLFGSIDANQGDPQLGWDTDQFPTHLNDVVQVIYLILQNGGFTTGGFNFDTKLRRQSIDLVDMFYGHISGIDTLARGLLIAAKLIETGELNHFVSERYASWQSDFGQQILQNKFDFDVLSQYVLKQDTNLQPVSGRQEMLEIVFSSIENE
jgi:xylose isomerase